VLDFSRSLQWCTLKNAISKGYDVITEKSYIFKFRKNLFYHTNIYPKKQWRVIFFGVRG